MSWNVISLSADFFVLAGAILQVGGKFWIRRLVGRRDLQLPAGAIRVDPTASMDNFDVFSFLSIGVGSIYFILNDLGISSSSPTLLAACVLEAAILLITGFESLSVEAQNSVEVYVWRVWPLSIKVFAAILLASMGLVATLLSEVAFGALDLAAAIPLILVSVALIAYIFKMSNPFTVKRKTPARSWG